MGALETCVVLNEACGQVWGWAGKRVQIRLAEHLVVGWGCGWKRGGWS